MNPFILNELGGEIVLASKSPRRRDILTALGFEFRVLPPGEDAESDVTDPDPYRLPEVLARRKCDQVAPSSNGAVVIAADTVVIVDGEILNKPADDEEARAFLARLSGVTHDVVTGVAVRCDARGYERSGSERTRVTFRSLSPEGIARYVASGEGRDKAGSYAAQGLGAGLIRSIDGCFYNVVGLPVALLLDLLDDIPKTG